MKSKKVNKGKAGKPPVAKAGQEVETMALSIVEPEEESFSYVGADSTAVIKITSLEVSESDDPDLAFAKQWEGEISKADSKGGEMPEGLLQQGIEVAKTLAAEANMVINMAQKSHAERAIMLGKVCMILKKMLKQLEPDTLWDVWATENLPFIGERNRQKFMRLAKREDCHRYAFLGVDRLDMLVAATEAMKKEKDPIGKLLKKYAIKFDERSDMEIGEFKRQIDAAIAAERLEEKGIKVDFQLVQDVINVNGKIDGPLIKRLNDLASYKGKPEDLLQDLLLSGGKKHGSSPDERPLDFNKLSADLIKTIDYLVEEPDYLDRLDDGIFEKLLASLQKLKKLLGAGNGAKKAA